MIFFKKPLGLPVVVVLSFLLGSIEALSAQTFKKLRLAYTGFDVGVTIALIGKETGLFKKAGLDIEQIYIKDAAYGGLQSLIGVDIVMGSGNPISTVQKILSGSDIVFLGSHVNMEQYKFGVASNINSIEQLRGKKIGVSGLGRKSDLIARVVLRRAGLDPTKDVKMVSVGFSLQRAAALSKDLIQGAPLVPMVAFEAQKLGLKLIKTKEVPYITSFLITTKSIIRKDENVIRKFLKGYVTSIHYYLSHREESIKIMNRFVEGVKPNTLETMYNDFVAQLTPSPDPDREALRAIINATSVIDEKANALKQTDLFDLRFLDEVKASGFLDKLYGEKVNL